MILAIKVTPEKICSNRKSVREINFQQMNIVFHLKTVADFAPVSEMYKFKYKGREKAGHSTPTFNTSFARLSETHQKFELNQNKTDTQN